MKIEDKPKYCHAWISRINRNVMCNTIPCCGFSSHGRTDVVTKGFTKTDKVGKHPLVNGEWVFKKHP